MIKCAKKILSLLNINRDEMRKREILKLTLDHKPIPFGRHLLATSLKCREDVVKDCERIFIKVLEFAGSCLRVLIDGQPVRTIGWEPYEVDISDFVSGKREFELGIEVYSHRKNTFGPLHINKKSESHELTVSRCGGSWMGPKAFVTEGKHWQDGYDLVPVDY